MRKSRLISVLLCLLALCCLFTSCNKNATDTTTPEGTPEVTTTERTRPTYTIVTTKKEPSPSEMPNDALVLIGGVNITSYKIVYNDTPLKDRAGSMTNKTIGEDIGEFLQGEEKACDFDYQSAVRLQQLIKDRYGYELEIVSDTVAKDPSRYEIIVGLADKRTAASRLEYGLLETEYACSIDTLTTVKTQYVICGGSYGATWHAIDELEKFFDQNPMESINGAIDLTSVSVTKGSYDFKNVACIGDSITRGSQGLPDGDTYANANSLTRQFGSNATGVYLEQYLSYPATLQRELWKDYIVYNYGQGWASMIDYFPGQKDTGPYYYNDTTKFKNCLTLSNRDDFEFDAVLMMLGTNDASKMKANMKADELETLTADFLADAKNLVDQILVGSPNAKIVMMNAPHRCDGDSENVKDTAMREIQKNIATTLKASGYKIYHYDMEAYTIENLGTGCGNTKETEEKAHEDYYNILTDAGGPDRTHPNYRGYGKIAEGMIDLLAYVLEDAQAPKYMINIG